MSAALSVGTRLRIARMNKGLNLAAVAGELDIGESYLSMIERDQRRPSAPLARRIIDFYGWSDDVTDLWPLDAEPRTAA